MAAEPKTLSLSVPELRHSNEKQPSRRRAASLACPHSPIISAPSILALRDVPEEKTKQRSLDPLILSPSFSRAFFLFCSSSPNLLLSFLPRLDEHDIVHFLNLTNFLECSSHVVSSLRGRSLRSACFLYVSLYLRQQSHSYLHSCIGTFLCMTCTQVFAPTANHKKILGNKKTLFSTFHSLLNLLASSLTELPDTVLVLLFGWKSKRPLEMLFENIIIPALESPGPELGFNASPSLLCFTRSLACLLKACRRVGVIDHDALAGSDAIEAKVAMLRGNKVQKKLKALSNDLERPQIEQDIPETYISFLELWEENHHPCNPGGPDACDIHLAFPPVVSLSVFQKVLEDQHEAVAKRMRKRAQGGKLSLEEVESSLPLMESLFSC